MTAWVKDVLWVALFYGWIPVYLIYKWLFDPLDGKLSHGVPDDWYPDHYN